MHSPLRPLRLGLLLALAWLVASGAQADEAGWAALARPGAVLLMRHADAPGIGDPPGMRLGDCSTQRNLGEAGRAQARRWGEALRQRGIRVERVISSQWCRTQDTARLAFGAMVPAGVQDEPAFNSFFGGQGDAARQTAAARALLRRWSGPGVLVVVTHQVNVQGLTGQSPASAEALVLLPALSPAAGDAPLQVLGRITAP